MNLKSATRQPRSANTLFWLVSAILPALSGAQAQAQEAPPFDAAQPRTMGLPGGDEHWTFNLDAGYGGFTFDYSFYANKRPDPSGNLSDNWQEGYVKTAVSSDFL